MAAEQQTIITVNGLCEGAGRDVKRGFVTKRIGTFYGYQPCEGKNPQHAFVLRWIILNTILHLLYVFFLYFEINARRILDDKPIKAKQLGES